MHVHCIIKFLSLLFYDSTGGDVSRPVWLNNLSCSSGSSCISSCASCPSVVGNTSLCSHEKNINIQCCKYIMSICYCTFQFYAYISSVMSPVQSSTSEQTIQKCQAIEAGNGEKREGGREREGEREGGREVMERHSLIFILLGVSVPGALILYRNGIVSTGFTSGRVVVYSGSSVWGNVCRYSSFSITSANVICHQLGYTGAASWSYESTDR